ncbi:MAG: hypothetical protein EOP87_04095 [Verrucomicrobiaceae bacterium]|nr:MAG: hypothetical protein EOP87_04095 [Verrucomicrobiaceae bacterium]
MSASLIDSTEELSAYLAGHSGGQNTPVCAIDTEADSLHRYRESLCLIQFADDSDCVLIDPLAIKDLNPLGDYLSGSVVWMHGADYDMTMLKRQFGRLPGKVYDTQIGARLLGARKFGLGDLVSHYFGIDLSKTSQKADWGKRPLSEKMVEYALNDVQGSGKLERRGLAFLRALWNWRDEEAKTWDRPSFMVAPNRQLLEWTIDLAGGRSVTLPGHFRGDRVKRFREALAGVAALAESEYPERPQGKRRKRDRDFDRKLDQFLKIRETAAAKLDIEGSLIAPRAVLESLAADEAVVEDVLLKWQRECLQLG